MDEGLIQFIVIAVFVLISIMDGAARKRRKEAQSRERIPQADDFGEVDADPGEVAQSSEGMVPEDLWKEIAALARGEVRGGEVGSLRGPATRDPDSTRDPSSEEGAWTASGQELPPNRVSGMDTGERVRWSAGRPERLDAPPPTGTRSLDLQGGYEHPDQAAAHQEHAEIASTVRQLPAERPHGPSLCSMPLRHRLPRLRRRRAVREVRGACLLVARVAPWGASAVRQTRFGVHPDMRLHPAPVLPCGSSSTTARQW